MPPQSVYDEMRDFEKRCNDRHTALNAYLVLYEGMNYKGMNEKGEPTVYKTTMVCPSATHVVMRFPSCVKLELLSDAYVSIAPIIDPPKLGEETDAEPVGASRAVPAVPPIPQGQPNPFARRVPLLPGLRLCRQCKFDPFKNPVRRCTGGGHRFDHDPATTVCIFFQFPD